MPDEFLAVAFDSGGVTTGPITVPFIMALGIGVASAGTRQQGRGADSFGLVALCSIGPILAVLILGMCLYRRGNRLHAPCPSPRCTPRRELLASSFCDGFPDYAQEVAAGACCPWWCSSCCSRSLPCICTRRPLIRIIVGIVYTYVGLVLFLTGVNVGFMPAGNYLGGQLSPSCPAAGC